jgi:hypothetical protein
MASFLFWFPDPLFTLLQPTPAPTSTSSNAFWLLVGFAYGSSGRRWEVERKVKSGSLFFHLPQPLPCLLELAEPLNWKPKLLSKVSCFEILGTPSSHTFKLKTCGKTSEYCTMPCGSFYSSVFAYVVCFLTGPKCKGICGKQICDCLSVL